MSTTVLHSIVAEAPNLAPSSRDKYRRDLDAWIAFAGADPSGWTRIKAQDFYNDLLKKIRPQSANRLFASVAFASKWWAIREQDPSRDFAIIAKASPSGKTVRHALSANDAMDLLNTTTWSRWRELIQLRDRALIVLGLETGMRRMSLVGMRLENIKEAPYPRVLVPIKGHGDDLYSVPLSDVVLTHLEPWRRLLPKRGPVFRPCPPTLGKTGPTRNVPSPLALMGGSIHTLVRQRAHMANLGDVHPHIFRHTFITWRTEAGSTDPQIAAMTGHTLKSSGALGGYKDMLKIGETSRQQTPPWLLEWKP